MKYENFKKATQIKKRIDRLREAQGNLNEFLSKYPDGDYDETAEGRSSNKLYEFYLNQYPDGGGLQIDLTGCMIASSILNELGKKIEKQIEKDLAELETL